MPTWFIPECNIYRSSFPSAIPKYRDNLQDPDPGKSYTKAKLQSLQENIENISQNQGNSNTKLISPQDERADDYFHKNLLVLPHIVPSDAFQYERITGKLSKKYTNVDAAMNSNEKGIRMIQFVHDLQVYKEPGKHHVFVRASC